MTVVTERASLPDPASVLALLVAGDRLPVVAALVLGSQTIDDIVARTELPARDVLRVLTRLEAAGLTSVEGSHWTLHVELLREIVTANRWARVQQDASADFVPPNTAASPQVAAVLRSFFRGNRLVRVPAQRTKRLIVLDVLARQFEPGVRYPEAEVNERLTTFHPDYAALRRYLVEEDFLGRENGIYWRAGGSVEI
ncbi:MAG: hypothetical protein QOJ62_1200 [Actinomycetota bacterium]|nr:hypothetical protein [Actinomycetota bacterium]